MRRALERPEVRAELLALLGMGDDGWRRARRLDEARAELVGWSCGKMSESMPLERALARPVKAPRTIRAYY